MWCGSWQKLEKFVPPHFQFSDDGKKFDDCALLVKPFSVVGQKGVSDEVKGRPLNRLRMLPLHTSISEDNDQVQPREEQQQMPDIRCTGERCSSHGMVFSN
jgi:hypothetical protein